MKKIGLTGGIGCGKSIVASIFTSLHIPVYNSDFEAKRLMNSHSKIREKIIALLGEQAYSENQLQKEVIAQAIFTNSNVRIKMNEIVHPIVREDFQLWASKQKSPYVIMESALLFDSDLYTLFDKTIFVNCPLEKRIENVMKRDSCSKESVLQRIEMQPNVEFCLKKTHYVVENNNTFVIPQVLEIHKSILTI